MSKVGVNKQTRIYFGPKISVCLAFSLYLIVLPFYANGLKTIPANTRSDEVEVLTPGRTYDKELDTNKTDHYEIELNRGQFMRVLFKSASPNLLVRVRSPDDQKLRECRSREFGSTSVSLIAKDSGFYRVEVSSNRKTSLLIPYNIGIAELRPAKISDAQLVAAETAYASGQVIQERNTADSLSSAIEKFKEAVNRWRVVGNRKEQAVSLKSIGELYFRLGDYNLSARYLGQAAKLRSDLQGTEEEADILNSLGYALLGLGESVKALEVCNEALLLFTKLGNRRGEAQALNNLGEVFYGLSQLDRAIDSYNRALPIFEQLKDEQGQAQVLMNYGIAYSLLRDSVKSLEYLDKARNFWRHVGDRRGEAFTLTVIGTEYTRTGEWQRASAVYDQALEFFETTGDVYGRARIYSCIGYLQVEAGNRMEAMRRYNQALPLFTQIGRPVALAGTLLNIGQVHLDLGEKQKALTDFQRALTLAEKLQDPLMQAYAIVDIGRAHEALSLTQNALVDYQRALPLFQKGGDKLWESHALNSIGSIYARSHELEKALDYFGKALPLARAINKPRETSLTLYNMAVALRQQGKLSEAQTHIVEALKLSETLRTKASTQDLRTAYFATVHQQFEFYIDLLMALDKQHPEAGYNLIALETSERARARSLVETLVESRADIRQGVDEGLLKREQELQKLLSEEAERQVRLSDSQNKAELKVIEKRIETLSSEYQQVEGRIKNASARYAALIQPSPLKSQEVQQLLDADTLLVEYSLGDSRSFVWTVTRDSITNFELPGREQIEKIARDLYDSLTAPNQEPASETFLQREVRLRQADLQFSKNSAALSKILLEPIAKLLLGKRLVFVADGILQYVPFSALLDPNRDPVSSDAKSLMANHEVVNLPSASVLAVQRSDMHQRPTPSLALAILADPVFDSNDARLAKGRSGRSSTTDFDQRSHEGIRRTRTVLSFGESDTDSSLRALRAFGLSAKRDRMSRLPFSRQEADAIFALAPQGAGLEALDFNASRATALSPDLSKYRIVHFATHGLLNNEHPELSGILLSMVNAEGRPQNGFLQLHEIYRLNLPADLIVLSACQTALGKDVKGEGLIGLTRGFMHAGAARVVASLWKVDDAATADLMTQFYKEMFVNGQRPAAALRSAQIFLSQQRRYQSPYFWAGFIIQGEWN